MHTLHRLRPGEPFPANVGTVIVIDVLRMTSTAAVLMRRPSCASLAVAGTLDDLAELSLPAPACVVVSELVSDRWPGTWVDNSPSRVAAVPFGERTPVLVTTNGTKALLAAAASADRVLLASFIDLHAVALHVREGAPRSVAILPAGHFSTGEARVEDDLCADALALLLDGREPDLSAIASAIHADPRVRRRVLTEPDYAADVEVALLPDRGASVLSFHAQRASLGVGRIVRAR